MHLYEERIITFIDLLGFTNTINKSIDNNVENIAETQKIHSLLDEVQWYIKYHDLLLDKLKIEGKIINQFSDSIIISYKKETDIFRVLLHIYSLCHIALENNFLLRGAITYGKIYHNENKIFGPGFIQAYNMEKKMAIYPRIIIDERIIEKAIKSYSESPDPDAEIRNLLQLAPKDFDGLHYINYFEKMIGVNNSFDDRKNLLDNINKIMNEMDLNDNSIKSKYLWMKEKLINAHTNLKSKYEDIDFVNINNAQVPKIENNHSLI